MTAPWIVAFCALACLTVMQGVLLLGITRRSVKVLERLERMSQGSDLVLPDSGLAVGETVANFSVRDANGVSVQSSSLLDRPRTLLIASLDCPACEAGLREIGDEPETVADSGLCILMPDSGEGRQFVGPAQFDVFYQSPELPVSVALESHLTPHAFVMSDSGVVLARGVGNSVEALNALWRQAIPPPGESSTVVRKQRVNY